MIKVNEYEQGAVKSLGFDSQGQAYTVGVVQPGGYTFSTGSEERLTVSVGALTVTLPDKQPLVVSVGQSIVIPKDVSFRMEARVASAYVCSYH